MSGPIDVRAFYLKMSMQRLLYGIQDPYSIPKSLSGTNPVIPISGNPPRSAELRVVVRNICIVLGPSLIEVYQIPCITGTGQCHCDLASWKPRCVKPSCDAEL